MKTCIALGVLLVVAWAVGMGCVDQKPKDVPPPPPPPPKVDITLPDGKLARDEEGVRRIAISLTLERQPNGQMIGEGFTFGGREVAMQLSRPLDEVVQLNVASVFKEMGFNVKPVGAVIPQNGAVVREEIRKDQADYLLVPYLNEFVVRTTPVANAPTFATVNMELQLFGPRGGLVTPYPVGIMVNMAWEFPGKPGPDELRKCVEEVLAQVRDKIAADPTLQKALGLELPDVAPKPAPGAGS